MIGLNPCNVSRKWTLDEWTTDCTLESDLDKMALFQFTSADDDDDDDPVGLLLLSVMFVRIVLSCGFVRRKGRSIIERGPNGNLPNRSYDKVWLIWLLRLYNNDSWNRWLFDFLRDGISILKLRHLQAYFCIANKVKKKINY